MSLKLHELMLDVLNTVDLKTQYSSKKTSLQPCTRTTEKVMER